MNWKTFGLKYDKRETWAFEQLSYLLFCAELNNRVGIFRYKNQTGIETEPIENEGRYYGFQAKYYTTLIRDNKIDIIDSIKKAKSKNSQLNELFFYVNQEFSEASRKDKKKPQYQLDIEKAAKEVEVNIQWRVPSHLELQLSLPENKYLHDIFFSLGPNQRDLLEEVSNHNENILQAIQTEISFGEKKIKIDRDTIVGGLTSSLQKKKNIVISGEGGCGKTSIFKEFYSVNSDKIPICIFKATELNVNHVNEIFQFENQYTFAQFLDVYSDEPVKVFAIDSAEKLAEITNNDLLNSLIKKLKEFDWIIIFTTRYGYLNDLTFHIKENYQLLFDVIDISLIGEDELISISEKYEFSLPENQKFLGRLRNLFYLNEYMNQYKNIDKQGSFKGFIELLWKKRIQNNIVQKDNVHLQREKCIISIAKKRYETGRFYVNGDDLPQSALFQLKQDEILGYDDAHNGYFITHDIYEEWTLDRIVSRCFLNYPTTKRFFDELGNTLPIRRAFRLWLSDYLYNNSNEIEGFITEAFTDKEISRFWRDEILVSVLLSDYSKAFFEFFEQEIIADDFKILKRVLFLLRIACTDISAFQNIEVIKPKGKGWGEVITLIYKYRSHFLEENLKLVLPVLTNWSEFNKLGNTTRDSGLLALSIFQKTETEENFYIEDGVEEDILKVIFNTAIELREELIEIFEKVVANKWINRRTPYHGLCAKILEKPYLAVDLIRTLPSNVIQLCDLFWQRQPRKDDGYGYGRDSMESRYGLTDRHKLEYFPASANQTPINWLLQIDFHKTLDFIIDFTNRSVDSYSQSDYGKDVEKVLLNVKGKEVIQFLSWAIWGMYRGSSSPVVPYLLQSIHMALEKVLLKFAEILEPKIVESILLKILSNSKSTSLTSIVCSVVLANSNKFYDIAYILFETIELFHLDSIRSMNESQAKVVYSIGHRMDKLKDTLYSDERMKSCEDKHRSSNLESLFLNYQLFGVKGFTEEQNSEFIEKLYQTIDAHKSNDSINKNYGILLARMDRRNLVPEISNHDDNNLLIEFSLKELPKNLKEKSEQSSDQFDEVFKYTYLRSWSNFLSGGNSENKNQKHEEYDKNPILALGETKELVKELESGRNGMGIMDYSIPGFSCSKLMLEHINMLSKGDKEYCKEIILSTVSGLFSDEYGYQISDGVEAAIHAIPSLINEYPDESENYILILVFALLDETSICNYKRICDYAIESIHKSKVWNNNQRVAQSILFSYIKLKPQYDLAVNQIRENQRDWGHISKKMIFEKIDEINPDIKFENVLFDRDDLDSFDIHELEIILQIIPPDTKDKIHLDIYDKSLPLLTSQLLIDRRNYKDLTGDDSQIHTIRLNIFRRFSSFILERKLGEIDRFLKPFVDSFSSTEETASFIEELVGAEDKLNRYEQFWYIWNFMYSKISELCNNPNGYYLEPIIINYLLAWRWWREGVEEWRSLKKDNLSIYFNASKDIGHIPSVIYSISRVLNSIGTHFQKEGIEWIHEIVSHNDALKLDKLETNTLYYLEKFLRKFVFLNKQKIKEEIRLKSKVLPILDFMIERGSIHGYLLRESIL